MNQLVTAGQAATMTSIDLLDLINTKRAEFNEGEVRRNDFTARCIDELDGDYYDSFVVTNANGTETTVLSLTLDQCMLVAMRESKSVRRNVLERLKELEQAAKPSLPDFTNPVAAARAWADAMERTQQQALTLQAQQLQLEQQQPAVEFVDRFVEAKSAKGFREVAKILGIKERDFISDLAADKIIFKQGSNWLPMADHQHAGRFVVKTGEANGHAYIQSRFTPDGIAWVAKRFTNRAA